MTRLEKCRAEVARTEQAYNTARSRKDRRGEHHTWIAFRDARVAEIMEERRAAHTPWFRGVWGALAAFFREQQLSARGGSQ